jgi:FixJ family two-component response regulator
MNKGLRLVEKVNNKMHIAVIEDFASVRDAISTLLASCGYTVDGYASSEEFLRSEAAGDIDCLLLDIGLPGISGLDLQRRLACTGCPPVVFMTGQEDRDGSLRASALSAGGLGFLRKPFEAEELLDAVRCALDQPTVRPTRPG